MRGLIGDRLLKRFLGNILHPPEFNQRRVLGSTSDNDETTREKAQSRTPDPGAEMTNASESENGAKSAVDEKAGSSPVWEDSMNGSTDKA
jgi:hypothetical protein